MMKKLGQLIVLVLCLVFMSVSVEVGYAAEQPYKGVTITFLTERLVHQEVLAKKMAEVAKKLGMDFRVQYLTSGDLRNKILMDFTAGVTTWDLIYTGGVRGMYEYRERGIIVPMNQFLDNPKLRDPKFKIEDFAESQFEPFVQEGKVMAFPTTMSVNVLAYRTDLFENEIEKKAFKTRYGYELAPPSTYEQFYDVAEFFTRKAGQKLAGLTLTSDFYGANQSNKPGSQLWNDYVNVMMAFGANLYDRKTMKPTWNSKENIAAGKFYVSITPFLHPSHINATSGEAAAQFAAGNVAMMVEYFDRITALCQDPKSAVYGRVGYALPPSREGGPSNRKHAFRMGPPPIGIFANSRNKEAAYKLLEQTLLPENQKDMSMEEPGYLPVSKTVLDDPEVQKKYPYLSYLKKASQRDVAALTDLETLGYPVILDFAPIVDIANAALSQALTGKASVEKAFDDAQKEMEALFVKLGYTKR